jgi:hypothetical protein
MVFSSELIMLVVEQKTFLRRYIMKLNITNYIPLVSLKRQNVLFRGKNISGNFEATTII